MTEPGQEAPEHSAPGGTAYATGLRARDKVHKLPCGCASDATRHIAFCEVQHRALAAHRSRLFEERERRTLAPNKPTEPTE